MTDVKIQGGYKTSQGPVCIWQGMNFAKWIQLLRMRPPMDIWHVPKILLTTVVTLHNSFAGFFERTFYEQRILSHQVKSPVFILGHWRSGTTLLHNLLSCDPQFTTTTLYRTLGFHHFLLTEWLAKRLTAPFLPKSRPMDNMEISWDAPQEDEAIICNLCLLSPYLMTAFHSDDSVYNRYFDLLTLDRQEKETWKEAFLYMLKKISFLDDKRPLLKSPTHSFRVAALLELFPDAKFIHIVRNPYDVFPSGIHMRKQILMENGLCYPDFSHIEEDYFQTYQALFERLQHDTAFLSHHQFYELKYESFEEDISGELRKIYENLELPGWSNLERLLRPKLKELKKYRKNKFTGLEESLRKKVLNGCRHVFEKYDYVM